MPRIIPFGQPVDYEEGFVRDERVDFYAAFSDPSEGIEELIEDWRLSMQRIVRAFAVAVPLFCVGYFGLRELLAMVLS